MTSSKNDQTSEEDEFDTVNPRAASLVEALRDIGYSLDSAVADIIDNSISAEASQIDIRFGWDEAQSPWLSITDNGFGMLDSELKEAMRPGGRDPMEKRPADDLGRFGLGLKTASFSQCRKVTVVSRKAGALSSRQWDLDLVRSLDKWILRKPKLDEVETLPGVSLPGESGTVVLWQNLDRLDLGNDTNRFHQVMNERVASICEHVARVFHRFITGEPGRSKVQICANNIPLQAFDPFNAKHPATIHLGEEPLDIEGETVTFKPYILPHHNKISASEYERFGGREGYLRGQGFYIYRNRRLIVHGTWFRMARQEEMTKLARVQVDIPNTLDHLWTIDVRKSRAQPPQAVKRRLRGILDRIRDTAKRPYTHRGTTAVASSGEAIWERSYESNRVSYVPNSRHALIAEFRSDLPESMRRRLDGILTVIGKALPFALLFNDIAQRPKEIDSTKETHAKLRELAALLFGKSENLDPESVESIMRSTEPFASSPDFVATYIAAISGVKEKS